MPVWPRTGSVVQCTPRRWNDGLALHPVPAGMHAWSRFFGSRRTGSAEPFAVLRNEFIRRTAIARNSIPRRTASVRRQRLTT